MKKWKNYSILLLALVLCLSLTACGDSKKNDDGENKAGETKAGGNDVEPDVGGTDWRTTGVWNTDGNSDVTMSFDDGYKELIMVWFWDTQSAHFVYQPEESRIDEYNVNNGNGNGSYSWDSELCQRNVSEFEGVWYYEGDLSATTYIIIDGYGNWSYFERSAGDPEGTEMDYGTFSYSADEISTYYADSSKYENLSMRVFEFDEGTLIWDDDTYYRME